MARPELRTLLRHIHHLAGPCAAAELSDRDLLERFAGRREEAAFAALVQRHGPLVLNVCRRLLRHEQDAEDVFQATFLVLARKAGSVRWRESVAAWLHAVAHRLALKARAEAVRRQRFEQQAALRRPAPGGDDLSWREVAHLLEEELVRLPERYRAPLLLCCWEGKARDEAARLLGWTAGMVKGRLERGRELLRRRLARRGVALSAGLLAVGLARGDVPAALADSSLRLALSAASETAGLVPAAVAALADAALAGTRFKVWGLVLALVLLTAGAGVWIRPTWGGATAAVADEFATEPSEPEVVLAGLPAAPPEKPAVKEAPAPPLAPPEDKPPAPLPWPREDREGNPFPAGVVQRFGSARLLHGQPVRLMEFSRDGKVLAVAGGDSVSLWDPEKGKELKRFGRQASCLALSPQGTLLALGEPARKGTSPAISILSTENGEVIDALRAEGLFQKGLVLTFAEDAKHLWTLDGGRVRRFAVGRLALKGQPEIEVKTDGDDPVAILNGGDARKPFVVLATRQRIQALDAMTGKLLWQSILGRPYIGLVVRDGLVAAVNPIGNVQFVEDGRETGRRLPLVGRTLALTLSGEGEDLCLTGVKGAHSDKELRVWNVRLRARTGLEERLLDKALSVPWAIDRAKVRLSPDGKLAAVAEAGSARVRLWDTASGKERFLSQQPTCEVRQVSAQGEGKAIACVDATGALLRLAAAGSVTRPPGYLAVTPPLPTVGLSADGKTIARAGPAGIMQLRDIETEKLLGDIGANVTIHCVTPGPDGKLVAFGTAVGAGLWRPADKSIRRLETDKESVTSLAFSPDGKLLAVVTGSTIGVWDTATATRLRTFPVPNGPGIATVALDPRGQMLAAARTGDALVTLFELTTGRVLRRCGQAGLGVRCLAFALGGRLLVAGDNEGLTLWETATGGEVLHLTGHRGPVTALVAISDGRRVVSASVDTTVLLWDLPAAWKETTPALPKGKEPPSLEQSSRDLHGEAAIAYRALFALAAERDKALPVLQRDLINTDKAAAPEPIPQKVAKLADADPKVRSRALEELRRVGAPAEPALRKALAAAKDEKLQARLRALLAELEADGLIEPAADMRYASRVVDLLELIDTKEARQLLARMARDGRTAALQGEAQAAIDRRARGEKQRP